MREKFTDRSFSDDSMKLIRWADGELSGLQQQGYRVSLRQLYYIGVTQNLYPNTTAAYKNLGKLISEARLAGWIDWDAIEDRGRRPVETQFWESPLDIMVKATEMFKINKWLDQPVHVEVMVEKSALEGIMIPVCREFEVPFHANKGYSSSSALYELGKSLQERAVVGRKRVVIIYAGDHDPSGCAMSQDVLERLQLFSQSQITVMRVALNMPQIERYNPPPQFSKESDTRTPAYIARYGTDKCYELDALPPRALAGIVRAAIKHHIDPDKWAKSEARELEMKDQLQTIVDSLTPEP